jgi:hypothetical protein
VRADIGLRFQDIDAHHIFDVVGVFRDRLITQKFPEIASAARMAALRRSCVYTPWLRSYTPKNSAP